MVAFNDQHQVLDKWKVRIMKRAMFGEIELTDRLNYNELVEHGFHL